MFKMVQIDSYSDSFCSIHLCSLFLSGWSDSGWDHGAAQHMDARLNTLTNELCQVNTHVGHIARWQAHLGGFVESPSPPLEAFEDNETSKDDDDFNDDDDEDRDASSSSVDKMST